MVASARAKLEGQLQRMGVGEPSLIDVADPATAEFIGEEQSDAISS
jgi:hypothetical protein